MIILSVFPGIDLLGRAFEEVWPEACLVRGPDLIWGGDIRTFHPPAGVFDGIIGGPPCQQFSPLVHLLRAQGREPKHPNLIPEFERIIREGEPAWFLMENVPPAPLPSVEGYGITAFRLCPTKLDSGNGFGHEQRRDRRFSFGLRGRPALDLRRWINYAALELAETAPTVTRTIIDNSAEAKGRVKTLVVTSHAETVPVRIGGSGKMKRSAVTGRGHSGNEGQYIRPAATAHVPPGQRQKTATVLAGHGPVGRGYGYGTRLSVAEMAELQGLPRDFLAESPFTMDGKRQMIGNGVPLSMGPAVARAVRLAVEADRGRPV